MDKREITTITEALYIQMAVGIALYVSENALTFEEIKVGIGAFLQCDKHADSLLADLVAKGIVMPLLFDGEIKYKATEFGEYFFSTLCSTNETAKTMCFRFRGIAT